MSPIRGRETELTLGLNWHGNPYVRWMFGCSRVWNAYPDDPVRPQTDLFAAQLQVSS